MKKSAKVVIVIVAVVVALLVIAAGAFFVINKINNRFRSVVVDAIKGNVELERDDEDEEIFDGLKLLAKDVVTTKSNGKVTLLVDDDKHILADSNTSFAVNAVGNSKKGYVTVDIEYGTAKFVIDNPLGEEDSFDVTTPNATLSVRGTIFTVKYDKESDTTVVTVKKGKVKAESTSSHEMLNKGDKAIITDDEITVIRAENDDEDADINDSVAEVMPGDEMDDPSSSGVDASQYERRVDGYYNITDEQLPELMIGDATNRQVAYMLAVKYYCENMSNGGLSIRKYVCEDLWYGSCPIRTVEAYTYSKDAVNNMLSIVSDEKIQGDEFRNMTVSGDNLVFTPCDVSGGDSLSRLSVETYFTPGGELYADEKFTFEYGSDGQTARDVSFTAVFTQVDGKYKYSRMENLVDSGSYDRY